jgi:hypothetical protein
VGPSVKAGEPFLLREVFRDRVWAARPHVVVEHRADLIAATIPAGTVTKWPADDDGALIRQQPADWRLVDLVWEEEPLYLRLHRPGEAHSTIAFWRGGQFEGWYVNLEEPWRESRFGWDYLDHKLDLIIWADGSWEWKDEDELDEAVEIGILTPIDAREIRDEGERVLAQFEAGASPFRDGWEEWQPDPAWPLPHLPEGWDRV